MSIKETACRISAATPDIAAMLQVRITTLARVGKDISGFTLAELVVGLAIASIVFIIASPNITSLREAIERSDAISQIEFGIRRARWEAIGSGAHAIMTVAPDGSSYSVGLDYLPLQDPIAADIVLMQEPLPSSVVLQLPEELIFDPRGFLIDSAGVPSRASLTLTQSGRQFASASISPIGVSSFNRNTGGS